MDRKDKFSGFLNEVQKVAEMKKATILYRLLKEAEAEREVRDEKDIRTLKNKLAEIQNALGISEEIFAESLQKLSAPQTHAAKAVNDSHAHTRTQANPQAVSARSTKSAPSPAPAAATTTQNTSSAGGANVESEEEEMTDWEVNFRKRYCVNTSCRYHFSVGKPFTKSFSRRCLKCGAATLFVIHS